MKLWILILFVITTKSILAADEKVYKFGIAPQQSATTLIEAWLPLIKKMEHDCKCKIEFITAPSISEFEEDTLKAKYDLIYLNPMHFVNSIKLGYTSLVREEGRKLKGIIVVQKNSQLKSLEELRNKKIAFPGDSAFAATILVRKKFEKKKIDIVPVYVKSHDSVFQNVISGLLPAGGAVNRTFDGLPEEDRAKLRILDSTDEVTPHPIAINKQIPKSIQDIFLTTLTGLHKSEDGKKILEKIQLKPLVKSKDSDWDDVRKLMDKI